MSESVSTPRLPFPTNSMEKAQCSRDSNIKAHHKRAKTRVWGYEKEGSAGSLIWGKCSFLLREKEMNIAQYYGYVMYLDLLNCWAPYHSDLPWFCLPRSKNYWLQTSSNTRVFHRQRDRQTDNKHHTYMCTNIYLIDQSDPSRMAGKNW